MQVGRGNPSPTTKKTGGETPPLRQKNGRGDPSPTAQKTGGETPPLRSKKREEKSSRLFIVLLFNVHIISNDMLHIVASDNLSTTQ